MAHLTETLPAKIDDTNFVTWMHTYQRMERDDPQRDALRRILVRDWFNEVGPTAIETWCFYFYDQEKDEIINMAFVTVAA